jgi:hypothetical protein
MKIKFFELTSDINISELFGTINNTKYSEKTDFGFTVSSMSDNRISAKYSIKLEYCEVVVDPFGNEEKIYLERFLNINFSIITKNKINFLIVKNPPRSIRLLIDSFSEIFDTNISISTFVIKPIDILDRFKSNFGSRNIKINEIRVPNYSISQNTAASMNIKSSGNLLEDIKKLSVLQESIDKVTIILSLNFQHLKIELTKNCYFIAPPEVIDYLEMEVIKSLT